ncbi:MAG: hypothetical protein HY710_10175 [Candidatus Latescibacteria bacterium]|nr:hypothetical protein [Candidatus Latescibacterota bacterium]
MQRLFMLASCILLATLCRPVQAQESASAIQDAIARYRDGRPADAIERLNDLLASPDTIGVERKARALAETYLALSYLATGRQEEAQAAVERAILTEPSALAEHADAWPKKHRAVIDSAAARLVTDAIRLYDDAEYERVIDQLQAVASLDGIVSQGLSAEVHTYLAFTYVAMNRLDRARHEFQTALQANPKLTLDDEAVVAPKLRRVFVTVRRETLSRARGRTLRNTFWRSLVLPGWGQVYRGQHVKGYGLMAAEAGLVTGAVIAVRSFIAARNAYVRFSTDEALVIYNQRRSIDDVNTAVQRRYDRYASSARRANVMVGLAAGFWGLNMLDALIVAHRDESRSRASHDQPAGLTMAWEPAAQQWLVKYQVMW